MVNFKVSSRGQFYLRQCSLEALQGPQEIHFSSLRPMDPTKIHNNKHRVSNSVNRQIALIVTQQSVPVQLVPVVTSLNLVELQVQHPRVVLHSILEVIKCEIKKLNY
jgi:hypothetical protein